MDATPNPDHELIREAIRSLCANYPGGYWRELEASGDYPDEFVDQLTSLGWLSVLIPEEYGGGGLGMTEGAIILEEIHRAGANAHACHAQMYTMGTLLRHGSSEQKERYLPQIASGDLRLQAFGITEAEAGSNTPEISTRAVRTNGDFEIYGAKMFISRVENSDLMLLLARTTPLDEVERKTDGLSIFLVDLREDRDKLAVQRIPMMFNYHTYEVFFDGFHVPGENLIGTEGHGFAQILGGLNAERILVASEAVGDGRFFVDRASTYASQRVVFGRPIGSNQGVQFPITQAAAHVEAASLMRDKAAHMFDNAIACGVEANLSKYLASEASWEAANAAVSAFGGNAFAVEFDIERKFRETKLFQTAPVNNNLILSYLANKWLGMPRSY